MNDVMNAKPSRKQIGFRLLYTLLYIVIFEIIKTIIQVAVIFQYIYMLITERPSEPVKRFSNKVCTYGYRVMRYMTLNENQKPFPFSEFQQEMDPPEEPVKFE